MRSKRRKSGLTRDLRVGMQASGVNLTTEQNPSLNYYFVSLSFLITVYVYGYALYNLNSARKHKVEVSANIDVRTIVDGISMFICSKRIIDGIFFCNANFILSS